MPWFITSICSETTMRELRKESNSFNLPNISRTFGFYNNHAEASKAVEENRCNMCECLYDYIAMEYIEEGIHPMVHAIEWWMWDEILNRWVSMDKEPKEFEGIVNWTLG